MPSMPLKLDPNFAEQGKRYFRDFSAGDDFYEMLIQMHAGLTDQQSAQVNAKMILLLANHIGDLSILRQAASIARKGV
jgi:hypothetical protein